MRNFYDSLRKTRNNNKRQIFSWRWIFSLVVPDTDIYMIGLASATQIIKRIHRIWMELRALRCLCTIPQFIGPTKNEPIYRFFSFFFHFSSNMHSIIFQPNCGSFISCILNANQLSVPIILKILKDLLDSWIEWRKIFYFSSTYVLCAEEVICKDLYYYYFLLLFYRHFYVSLSISTQMS